MEIKLDDIQEFSKKYNSNFVNKIIENAIVKNGIEEVMLERNILIENQPVFNIELPESKDIIRKTVLNVGFIQDLIC